MKPSLHRALSLLVVLVILLATLAGSAEDIAGESLPPVSVEETAPLPTDGAGLSDATEPPSVSAEEDSASSLSADAAGDLPALPDPSASPEPAEIAETPAAPPPSEGVDAPFDIRRIEIESDGDALSVLLVTGDAAYDRIYIGNRADETREPYYLRADNGDGTYAFRFPLSAAPVGARISFVPGRADGTWNADELYFVVPFAEHSLLAAAEPTDGGYTIDVDSSSAMFKVVGCSLDIKAGQIVATIALSGTGYDKLFVGTAADAATADPSQYIHYVLNADSQYTFAVPVSALDAPVAIAAYGVSGAKWYDRTLTFKSESLKPVTPPAPAYDDGGYTIDVDSSSAMFKVAGCSLDIKAGQIVATIALSGTGYDKLFVGTAADAATADPSQYIHYVLNADSQYTFAVPVSALDAPVAVAAYGVSGAKWYDRTLTFKSESLKRVTPAPAYDDGDYTIDVESSSSMFKVVGCSLDIKAGQIVATIALSGTGYDKLFVGTAADAATADPSQYIHYVLSADSLYSFTLPVAALDEPIAIAAHSTKSASWFDRTLTFKSGTMAPVGGATPTPVPTASPTAPPTPEPTKAPELDGATKGVDNSTSLADGTYAPDAFSFTGGTGRVGITCPSVAVKGGKAFATIVFSSPHYAYLKASGSKYYGSHGADSSTFAIPVRLNADNAIIGMTTAMSREYEVKYTINVYIAAADASAGEAAVANAPAVSGLRYESTDENEFAERFAVHRYADGYAILSVDAGDDDKLEYLLVPEGAEVPAGAGMAVIRLPVKNAYVASGAVLDLMGAIGFLDPFTLIGCETDARGAFAGEYTAPDYSALLLGGCDLAILPAAATDGEVAAVSENLAMLGIPLFIDRSADETSADARLEWLRLYGVLFGCEHLVEQYFAERAAQ